MENHYLGQSIRNMNIGGIRKGLERTLTGTLILKEVQDCPFCMIEMLPGEKVVELPCWESHVMHKNCYENFIKFAEKNRKPLACPICRKNFNKDQIKLRKIDVKEPEAP